VLRTVRDLTTRWAVIMTVRPSLLGAVGVGALLVIVILIKPSETSDMSRYKREPAAEVWQYACQKCDEHWESKNERSAPPKCERHGRMQLIKRPGKG